MWVSQEKRMVYLASPKTASKATKEAIRWLGFEKDGGHHDTLSAHPGVGWTVFTVVRHHWDAWVSWYCYAADMSHPLDAKWIAHHMEVDCPEHFPNPNGMWARHMEFADRILRYENLAEDLSSVLGCTIILPTVNVSTRRGKRHYSEFYDEATQEYVARHFKGEIERFGYKFGG